MSAIAFGFAAITLIVLRSIALSDQFEERKRERIEICRAIPAENYSTGLIFNPPGQSTMFERSACLQELAYEERDVDLCREVRERKSWFFDGSAISEDSCRERVVKRIEQDRQEAAARDFHSVHRLSSIQVFKNGNGTDFDVIVRTEGSFPGIYELSITVLAPQGHTPILIHKRSYSYGGPNVPRQIWLRRGDLTDALGHNFQELRLAAHVTLQLEKTDYNRFYYDLIPAENRTSELHADISFAGLPRWEPDDTH